MSYTILSEHDPISLELMNMSFSMKQFWFENTWLQEANFKEDVIKCWEGLPPSPLLLKLISVSSFMMRCG